MNEARAAFMRFDVELVCHGGAGAAAVAAELACRLLYRMPRPVYALSLTSWSTRDGRTSGSLFPYGHTGSGKSYAVLGTGWVLDESVADDDYGVVPRLAAQTL